VAIVRRPQLSYIEVAGTVYFSTWMRGLQARQRAYNETEEGRTAEDGVRVLVMAAAMSVSNVE
jgi:hypothetical protein